MLTMTLSTNPDVQGTVAPAGGRGYKSGLSCLAGNTERQISRFLLP